MRVVFVGVGEAFDHLLPTCSVLLMTRAGGVPRTMLLDCGFTTPYAYFREAPPEAPPLELDALYLSHFHGDHFFGVPALLLRFHEEGRRKPLVIVGQDQVEDKVLAALDLAYPGLWLKFSYQLDFVVAREGLSRHILGFDLDFAHSEHSLSNLAVRVSDGGKVVFYSGDGRPTEASRRLAQGVDLMIHESFSLDPDVPGHGTVPGSIAMAREVGAKRLAIVHVRREVRHPLREVILDLCRQAGDVRAFLPEPGEVVEV